MKFSWWTFALQAVNFVVLVWLLRRFLFKPVTAIVARRKEELARGMAEAAAEKQAALSLQRDLQAQRAGIEVERQKALEEQRSQTASERKRIIDEARAEAEKIHTQATMQLTEERTAATQELFSQTIELAVKLAERMLRELALSASEQAFLTHALGYLDHLAPRERDALVAQLRANSLVVKTAHQLDANEQAQWREGLGKRIGAAVGIDFNTDPALIAGAEIVFPSAILRFNWRDSLATAAREIHRDEHAD
jgi:F-type H+-transporting ATPase subunit b